MAKTTSTKKKAPAAKKPAAGKATSAAKKPAAKPSASPVKAPAKSSTAKLPSAPAKSGSAKGAGTREQPWMLTTPSGSSQYQMYKDETADPPLLVCTVGTTVLRYHLRALDDLHTMLKAHGDWMPLGSADEQKPAAEGTVEAWGRSPQNPVGGWYGTKNGLRGRFGMYIPPLMEALGMAEVEHYPKNNRMRAK
jgi:hypothetical protein